MRRNLLLLLCLNLISVLWAHAQLPIRTDVVSSTGRDRIVASATDSRGRMYLLGHHYSGNSSSNDPLVLRTSSGTRTLDNYDGQFLTILNAQGGLERHQNLGTTYWNTLAVDKGGNIYLTGMIRSYTFGLVKLAPDLQTTWTLTYGTSGGAYGQKILVDAQDNVYVSGTANNWSIFNLILRPRTCCPENDFLIKVTPQGQLAWVRAGWGGQNETLQSTGSSIAFDRQGNVVMVGNIRGSGTYGNTLVSGGNSAVLAVKYSPSGQVLWARSYGNTQYNVYGTSGGEDVVTDELGNIYVGGFFRATQRFGNLTLTSPHYYDDALLLKLTTDGEPVWVRAGGYRPGTNLSSAHYGTLAYRLGQLRAAGYCQTNSQYKSSPVVDAYDINGKRRWHSGLDARTFGTVEQVLLDEQNLTHIFGGYEDTLHAGNSQWPSLGFEDGFYTRLLDSTRLGASCVLRGRIFQDVNRNCLPDPTELPLAGIAVVAQPGNHFGITDGAGFFTIAVDTGRYTVQQLLPPNEPGRVMQQTCQPGGSVVLATPGESSALLHFGNEVGVAPLLRVSLSSNRRRRCFRNITTVAYGNYGFAPAPSAAVTVVLPPEVRFLSANLPYIRNTQGQLVFAVGALEPGAAGTIVIQDSVVCGDPGLRGRTVCTNAWISPGNTYPVTSGWNEASITIRGTASAAREARFVVRNTGRGAMRDSLNLRLFQDAELALQHHYQLGAGDSLVLRVPATRAMVRLEADQPPAHPHQRVAIAQVELRALATAGQPSEAMRSLPPNEPAPESAESCLPILDSYDPNDKQVLPTGVTAQHYTPTQTRLRYRIRFQNTGSDDAYRVEVVDTLSRSLDISSLRVESASHPYRLRVTGTGQPVLAFLFTDIDLPPRSRDEPGSNGFVEFSVLPHPTLPARTQIDNHADIFFDYNEPIRTNTTTNRIYDVPATVNPTVALDYEQLLISPQVTALTPLQGRAGTQVVVTGKQFASTGQNRVLFQGLPAQVLSTSPTALTIRVPAGAVSGSVQVITPDGSGRSTQPFTVYQPPTLTALSPAEGVVGTVVTLTGTGFSPVTAQDTVYFNGLPATVLSATTTSLQVRVPLRASTGQISLSTLGGRVISVASFTVWQLPALLTFTPAKARTGALVTLTGQAFAEAARTRVYFGNATGQIIHASASSLQVRVPADAASGPIRVQTPGGQAVAASDFIFLPPPVLTSFSPGTGRVGDLITLRGQHFGVDGLPDTISVGDIQVPALTSSDTTLQIRVPLGARTGTLMVAGRGGQVRSQRPLEIVTLSPEEAIETFPNPTAAMLFVRWNHADFAVQKIRLFNSQGRLLREQDVAGQTHPELTLDLRFHASGLYLLVVQTSRGVVTKRITRL